MTVSLRTTNLFEALTLLLSTVCFVAGCARFVFAKSLDHKVEAIWLIVVAVYLRTP